MSFEFQKSKRLCARGERWGKTRAVTLIEVMNFLTLAGILGMLTMYGVARYLRHSKTAEAMGTITSLGKNAAVFYEGSDSTQPAGTSPELAHAMRHFPESSRSAVPSNPEFIRGKRYRSSSAEWARSPWRELNFTMSQPQHYMYEFSSQGSGKSSACTAKASGDLDGDGTLSSYSLQVRPNAQGTPEIDPAVSITDSEE